ncbi:Bug family tripartite tricarboxylate transporter substrate binding protein [Tropicimonas sediminicola]|uniref:Tripartite-type tricarboxylate transporter, receptor component TctC n=1 Tax=Tropicimonas sediminicola TaxID=1031541 RepID=A0A239M3P2_9RHOB|nr:tripartite tricarboxylate transporter substrate binding protein [Tropicimonas sediminicola]SNT37447.1 Tripartite-type tricarboxylate transporter, receptor component TctC [Tropicimonas sediminicola]
MKTRTLTSALLSSVIAVGLVGTGSQARAEFPEKPVEMTILFGSTAQTIGQLLADLMSKNLPEPVVPVSRAGGGGAVGYQYVQSTDADGYNIVWNSNSISTSYHGGRIDFDYTAFEPIAKISVEVPAIAVRADSGWDSLTDMAADIKEKGTKLKVGASGKGSFTHLTTEAILASQGLTDMAVHVPYDQGRAPVELIAGRLDAAVQWPGQFISHHEAGTLKILCVTSAKRIGQLPDVPTCEESGAEGMDITMWRGLAAPAGTPMEVITKLEAAAKAAAESDEFKEAAQTIGFELDFADHATFGELIARDDADIAKLLEDVGLKAQ